MASAQRRPIPELGNSHAAQQGDGEGGRNNEELPRVPSGEYAVDALYFGRSRLARGDLHETVFTQQPHSYADSPVANIRGIGPRLNLIADGVVDV